MSLTLRRRYAVQAIEVSGLAPDGPLNPEVPALRVKLGGRLHIVSAWSWSSTRERFVRAHGYQVGPF